MSAGPTCLAVLAPPAAPRLSSSTYPTQSDRNQHDAVRAAATFLHEHAGLQPDGAAPTNATQFAVLAIEIHGTFLRRDEETDQTTVVDPDPDVVRPHPYEPLARLSGLPFG